MKNYFKFLFGKKEYAKETGKLNNEEQQVILKNRMNDYKREKQNSLPNDWNIFDVKEKIVWLEQNLQEEEQKEFFSPPS